MKRRTGRIQLPFERIVELADKVAASGDARFDLAGLALSRKSACYRCKDGTVTVSLIWAGENSLRVSYTVRGVRP